MRESRGGLGRARPRRQLFAPSPPHQSCLGEAGRDWSKCQQEVAALKACSSKAAAKNEAKPTTPR